MAVNVHVQSPPLPKLSSWYKGLNHSINYQYCTKLGTLLMTRHGGILKSEFNTYSTPYQKKLWIRSCQAAHGQSLHLNIELHIFTVQYRTVLRTPYITV